MSTNRLETLKSLVAATPSDSFLRYGLAMEYRSQGDYEQAAAEFGALLDADPDYAAAYYHGGQTLERLGRLEEARALYQRGLAVTARQGKTHAQSEMQAALDLLG